MSKVADGVGIGALGTAFVTLGVTQGIGVPAFLILLALKLGLGETAVEAWSWWTVTAPVWGGVALSAALAVVAFVAAVVSVVRD
jgi:hypothetical protein